ncbi:unnamed protein product [Adineta steineri]|uniref:Uncharacterized protein n=2 Tax=Adineta steineri TaxID=433720 RepID=A0A819HMW4_9BILA|nr:unnamed protein product [Adineta steineri]CAF3902553.1 unnamed protein product [Adineta steineri]
MANNSYEYKNLDDTPSQTNESMNLRSIPDNNSETDANIPLLGVTNDKQQSLYEEVAVNVSNHDDPTVLCLTFRSVFVGILLTFVKAFTDQFFNLRTLPLALDIGIIMLLSSMMGKFLHKILPEKIFNMTVNSKPFSVKEHTLAVIMTMSVDCDTPPTLAIVVQRVYYNYYLHHFNTIIFLITFHLFALSIAGILKRYLVWPSAMIWPTTLMTCCVIRTLHHEDETELNRSRWTMSRFKFFWLMFLFQFLWYWFPGYIFPLLASFSFVCMIAPDNIIFSQITGANGLGVGALQLDWNAWVSFLDSPILVPFWAHVNTFVGFVLAVWIIIPILYYTNAWESQKMPIVSNSVFDINGYYYNTSKVLDNNSQLNETAYNIYGSDMRLPLGFVVVFGFTLAGFSAAIVHTILYHGKSCVEQFRISLEDQKNDVHAQLMSHYAEVPEFWYYILFVVSLILGTINGYHNELLSGHVLLITMILNIMFVVPFGFIMATTGFQIGSYILPFVIGSFLLLGNPLSFIIYEAYSVGCQNKIVVFLILLKTAHYMKIPPRISFPFLILCPIIGSIVSYITMIYLLNNIPNICTRENSQWRCLATETSYSLTIIWAVVGFVRLLGPKSMYSSLLYGLIIGPILPIISWFLCRKFPHVKWLTLINFPVILLAVYAIPTTSTAEYPSWFLVGFIFNFVLYRHAHGWWEKYAYVFSAAMSCGVAVCGILITFALQNNDISFPQWWGTTDVCPLAGANYSGVIPTYHEL